MQVADADDKQTDSFPAKPCRGLVLRGVNKSKDANIFRRNDYDWSKHFLLPLPTVLQPIPIFGTIQIQISLFQIRSLTKIYERHYS